MSNEKETILDWLGDSEIASYIKKDILPHIETKLLRMNGYSGIYIDFDNFWFSVLDITASFVSEKRINEELKKEIIFNLNNTIDSFISNIENKYKTEIRFIKAYADFTKLPLSNSIDIIDELRKKGIQTITPYVRGYKDMSDRALMVGIMEDLLHENENLDKMFILTGDIDYYPLFEFISRNYKNEFFIMSFENRLNSEYEKIFFIKNKIISLDDITDKNSKELEYKKKQSCIKEFLSEKNLDIKKGLNYKETLNNLNKFYYLRFKESDLNEYKKGIK